MNEPEPHWRKVFHPTDFSEASEVAFAHALKLTLLGKGALSNWHLEPPDAEYLLWGDYPRIRGTLERWGVLPAGSAPGDVSKLGITVQKVQAHGHSVTHGIVTLQGRLPSSYLKQIAQTRVCGVDGGLEVRSEIEVTD